MKPKRRPRLSLTLWFTVLLFVENLIAVGISSASVSLIISFVGESIVIAPEIMVLIFSLVLGTVLALVSNKLFLAPMRKLNDKMGQVAKGDFTVRVEQRTRVKEIANIYKNFNTMVSELASLETIQSDFVANVSHEFKTPLSAIEGYSMLLQGTKGVTKDQERYIDKILFNTKRLSDLVGNILLLAKLDNQTIKAKNKTYRLDEQIRQSIMLYEIAWTNKNLSLDVDLEAVQFTGTEDLMFHVWNNLLGNAIKFSPDNVPLEITLKKNGEKIIFTIMDNGPGINEKAINHVFDKFYQGDSAHKEEGSGLGLSLVARIVSINGGKVSVENRESGGAIFTVELLRNGKVQE